MFKANAIFTAMIMVSSASVFAADSVPAKEKNQVNVVTFQGGWNLPLWVAQEKGFFKKNNVNIDLTYTLNSKQVVKGLMDDTYQVAIAGLDNVIAYQEGQGELPLKTDMFAFMGVDNGLLSLVTSPAIKSANDLKGKHLSVDALTTGYAFVLKDYVTTHGISEKDVDFTSVGSTDRRYTALIEGKTDATLLRTPLDIQAKNKGFNVLASGKSLGDFQGTVGVATRHWAEKEPENLVNFIRSYREALHWIYDPANKKSAETLLSTHVKGMTPELAAAALSELKDNGWQREAEINEKGVVNVMKLRAKYATPSKELTDPKKYYDMIYYDKAK